MSGQEQLMVGLKCEAIDEIIAIKDEITKARLCIRDSVKAYKNFVAKKEAEILHLEQCIRTNTYEPELELDEKSN